MLAMNSLEAEFFAACVSSGLCVLALIVNAFFVRSMMLLDEKGRWAQNDDLREVRFPDSVVGRGNKLVPVFKSRWFFWWYVVDMKEVPFFDTTWIDTRLFC